MVALKALLCSLFYPGMQWIRSFQDESDGTTRCFYVANSVGDIEYHAAVVAVPCLGIRPVTEVRPDGSGQIVVGGADPNRDPEADDPELLTWVVRQHLHRRSDSEVACAPWQPGNGQAGWLRTFIDREADELFSVFREYSGERVQRLAEDCGFATIEVRQMNQGLPADVAESNGLSLSPYGAARAAAHV
jgi:hypothetical protein